ncbi:GNAT family N-acetyltransferase [Lysinibacillus sp. NPDC094403]|uniref:GNAT family N-acetyltransferase n=1 Tax=Lysinibacillus sp. NPDC094403 TaxID=3390581 RepID=UPI003D07C21A
MYADLAEIQKDSAEIGIAIGESELWGKGIGTTATQMFINYASVKFNITKIYGAIVSLKIYGVEVSILSKLKVEERL